MITTLIILFICSPLLPLVPSPHWAFRFFDFVRVQSVVIQWVVILLAIFFWNEWQWYHWMLISLITAVMLYQCYIIRPYTPFYHRRQPEKEFAADRLKLVVANVLQTNTNYQSFIDVIKQDTPHIFVTMESDEKWHRAVSMAFPEYEHTVEVSLDNFYGMHMYSRIPFDTAEVKYLVQDDIPSIHCELQFAKQRFNLIAVHPTPPSPTENETSKERDAELMLVGKLCREKTESTVVCGDLNDVVWSKTSKLFTKMTGYFDPRIGRGLYPSFHAKMWLLRFPLDHLFYSKDMHVPVLKRLAPFGSDHFAMYYELAFPLVDEQVHNPDLQEEEKEEINTIIEEAE